MMTVKQVSLLTGVSVRTLQFYDEIGLFKPTGLTDAGYRLYDDSALETLQQILFFKELDFTLKEIKTIMANPGFNKSAAYEKQRQLFLMKRDRLNSLLVLLDKLIKGEKCMNFKEFDMSGYFRILDDFRQNHGDDIIIQMGSMELFDEMIADMKCREDEIAHMAVKQYGSIEKYAAAMKESFGKYLTQGSDVSSADVSQIIYEVDTLTKKLTADLNRDVRETEVQLAVSELIALCNESNQGMDMGENYWSFMANNYLTNQAFITSTDKKYGYGASEFIGQALTAYIECH